MEPNIGFRKTLACASAAAAMNICAPGVAAEIAGSYAFPAAAQEITQLFWLAETASACGWATREEATRFQLFAVRFLSAHLEGTHRSALAAMVGDGSYAERVQKAAAQQAPESCGQSRWQSGWVAYKAAAEENEIAY
jgi:hypothetical protein